MRSGTTMSVANAANAAQAAKIANVAGWTGLAAPVVVMTGVGVGTGLADKDAPVMPMLYGSMGTGLAVGALGLVAGRRLPAASQAMTNFGGAALASGFVGALVAGGANAVARPS